MGVVIGIDVGGSTTKIVGFRRDGDTDVMVGEPLFITATDPLTSVYGAFGKFTVQNGLALGDIERVMMTGVGAGCIRESIYSLPCESVPEFRSIGLGGLYLTGLDRAIVVSMGTGTAIVHACRGKESDYLGGTGVGGGTLMGLSKKLIGMEDIRHVQELAHAGDLRRVDLTVGDIAGQDGMSIRSDMTAANFGRVGDRTTPSDLALGLMNMVFETIGMMAIFAARGKGTRDIILTGNMTSVDYAHKIFPALSNMFDVNFIIPDHAQFATVIGTALVR